MKPTRGRESLKDRLARNESAMAMYASSRPIGKPMGDLPRPPVTSTVNPLADKPKRATHAKGGTVGVPYESQVQAEIIAYLKTRDDIGAITRLNSGTGSETDAHGNTRYIMFNRTFAKGMRVCDLQCMLKPSGRLVAIEVKRPGFKEPKSPREREQANYLSHVRTCGGIGFFATSVADVERGLSIK